MNLPPELHILRSRLCIVFLAAASIVPFVASAESSSPAPSYDSLYTQLLALSPDGQHVGVVHDVTIVRDVARFHLDSGHLCLLAPVAGRVIGAVFWGDGDATVVPPTQIEREQLQRFTGDTTMHRAFTSLVLLFTDTTLGELYAHTHFAPQPPDEAAQKLVTDAVAYLSYEPASWFDSDIMEQLLNGRHGLFHAQMNLEKEKTWFFRIDPNDEEEVSLQWNPSTSGHGREVICQFHLRDDGLWGARVPENKSVIAITNCAVECTIPSNLAFSARATLKIRAVAPDQSWVRFGLSGRLDVDSVSWDGARPCQYFRGVRNWELWVRCDPPLARGDTRTCTIAYHGDFIERTDNYFFLRSSTQWYPNGGDRQYLFFDLTFHVAKEYTLVSIGDSLPSTSSDDMVTTRWKTAYPIRGASFNIGQFNRHDAADTLGLPFSVLMAKYVHTGFGSDMEKNVTEDITKSLTFFQSVYGKLPLSHFYATEIPSLTHGEAFPGLIHLAWSTFQAQGTRGADEVFRSHEVAHQWWGIGVDYNTYHDQWISEGISDFSGLWYMQTVLRDNTKYFDMLNLWKKAIFDDRSFLLKKGQKAGPIWLGYRTNSSGTRGDYDLIIYKKGAWAMHMLRNMLIDLKTMNEDVFIATMQDAQRTYQGKRMSTEDFRAIVERHAGRDMRWFFNQWIYGTEEPTYACAYNVEKTPQNKYVAHCRITQRNVAPLFQMPMIVKIDFGDNRLARVRMTVTGPVTNVDLPLPLEPKNIVFNDLESVLCTVENVDW